MKKQYRVLDNKDFTNVIKNGHFSKSPSSKVYWLENNLGYVRVGIASPTKIGNAVVRSTLRRKLRAICDLLIDYQKYSLDIIIIPKNLFLDNDYLSNKNDLENILVKELGIKK